MYEANQIRAWLLFACLTCTRAFTQYEDFGDYTAGDYICVQSDLFDIWPGGAERGGNRGHQSADSRR